LTLGRGAIVCMLAVPCAAAAQSDQLDDVCQHDVAGAPYQMSPGIPYDMTAQDWAAIARTDPMLLQWEANEALDEAQHGDSVATVETPQTPPSPGSILQKLVDAELLRVDAFSQDLNGDGQAEIILWLFSRTTCFTGAGLATCEVVVLDSAQPRHRLGTSRGECLVLDRRKTHGWDDFRVISVNDDGVIAIDPYRFEGKGYVRFGPTLRAPVHLKN
jgi:hypothetical protein